MILLVSSAHGETVTATYQSAADVPVTAAAYTATGNSVAFTLNFAPATGTSLMVVRNTGAAFIQGTFDNLPQGTKTSLSFGGKTYPFVANYFGGTGNDLVLQWDNSRLLSWGYNGDGQIGQGPGLDSAITVPGTVAPALLSGRSVIAAGGGGYVGLAACADGTFASWGRSDQTGISGTQDPGTGYLVDTTGVLAGKTVVGMSAGFEHILALCSDGTMATWGKNIFYVFGSSQPQKYATPVAVEKTGALAGKSVVAVNSGTFHNIALCSDGKVVGWGRSSSGQLGNGSFDSVSVPVAVNTSGLLAGKTVVSIATGRDHTLALCADGSLVSWGANAAGQLGNNSTTDSNLPVAVNVSGVLAGKTITAISAGAYHSLALCSDGTLATWGDNGSGQLGNNSTTQSNVPVAVIRTGVLAGKTVTTIAAGQNHNLVCCSDGSAAAWGYNSQRQLGTTTSSSQSLVPILVGASSLRAGERFVRAFNGPLSSSSYAITASVPLPEASVQDATLVTDNTATLNGSVNANGTTTSVTFEFGTTTAYGNSGTATPATVSGTTTTAVSRQITGLLPGTTYHYRLVSTGAAGTLTTPDRTFTTLNLAALAGLSLSEGTLDPAFAGNIASYDATVPFSAATITVTPVVATPGATVKVNGSPVPSGSASAPLSLIVGTNTIPVAVTSPDGRTTKTYTIKVIRLPQTFAFPSATTVPVTANGFFASGDAPPVQLGFAPAPGTTLTVLRNTSATPIRGGFANLVHGQILTLAYQQASYRYVVNYYGGSGNDLVLMWANTQLLSWGLNTQGQLGDASTTLRRLPVAVDASGPLAGKSVIALSAGINHSVALCSDGKMLAWGSPDVLGTGTYVFPSSTPQAVSTSGILAGKTVATLSAGFNFNHAVCTDGTLVAWGDNRYGQLGDGTQNNRLAPVAVDTSGALAGKQVIAVSGGSSYALALCGDGTVMSWGANFYGELGVTPQKSYDSPVPVDRSGVLAGKSVVAVAAGGFHALALCSDGSLASWGWNSTGQLGNNSTTNSLVPVSVNQSGVLAGKTIVAISASDNHSMVLCSDGTLAAWGANGSGQLGDNTTTNRLVPVAVNRTGFLSGKTVLGISTARSHSLAACTDGSLAAWGSNIDGQLGTGTTTSSPVPVEVNKSAFGSLTRFVTGNTGPPASHNLGLLALPLPAASTNTAQQIGGTSATLRANVSANGSSTTVFFEYGPTTDYGTLIPAATLAASASGPVTAVLQGLAPGTVHHFRVRAENASGVVLGGDMTFTTLSDNAYLENLEPRRTTMVPTFDRNLTDYVTTIPFDVDSLAITAVTEHSQATATIGAIPVGTGGGTTTLGMAVGTTRVPVVVTAEDGVTRRTYQLGVTRLPSEFVFNSAADMPVTADEFSAGGHEVRIVLNFNPTPGTILTMVNNTGLGFIHGTFGNLDQGRRVTLTHGGRSYDFVANYFGGSGNDLVLQWADTQALGWGADRYGQLGDNGTADRPWPAPVDASGVLSGKTVTAVSAGYLHSLALCADGTLAAWGYNVYGQLGNKGNTPSGVPVAVDRTGVLAGRTVVAISAGPFHNLALCSDGTLAAWGYNNHGQLGTGDKTNRTAPVLVPRLGALAGRQVVGIAAAAYHSFARCSDGSVVAWGYNDEGELGDGTTNGSLLPVAVDVSGALAGRKVTALAAGQYHALALCSDGTLVSWGYNQYGQLGNHSTVSSKVPVSITSSGALAGKPAAAIAAGQYHSLALCSDGTVVSWGRNQYGQLGITGVPTREIPAAIDLSAITSGGNIVRIAAGSGHSLVVRSDGAAAAWGHNSNGQLGNRTTISSATPSMVDTTSLESGTRLMFVVAGSAAQHSLAVAALPATSPAPTEAGILASGENGGNPDLIRYAFGLKPGETLVGRLPGLQRIGGECVVSFTEPAGVTGITYGAEWSDTLLPGSWTDVPDTGTAQEHVFRVPAADAPRRFIRLKVTRP